MKTYAGCDIRNVAVVGHAHAGKTSLIASVLKTAKMSPGARSENGGGAHDEDEIARGMTMSNSVAFAEWSGLKVNLLDTPGFHMFVHEVRAALLAAETAAIVVNAQTGIEAITDRVWNFAAEVSLPRVIVINQADHPKADSRVGRMEMLEGMREHWGRQVVPVQLPIIDQHGFHGIVDLVTMDAFLYTPDGDGRGTRAAIPHMLENDAKAAHEALIELVAEGKDELMEEFFAVGTIPEEHLISALHEAIREDRIFPVLYASGMRNVGTDHLMDFLKVYAPCPQERAPFAARNAARHAGNGSSPDRVTRRVEDNGPATLFFFKTMIDPFAGRISLFKVISGCIKNDISLENYNRGETERLAHLSIVQGRKLSEVGELHAGDVGAVAKLRVTQTGETMGAKGHDVLIEPAAVPEPAMTYAIEPKSRADEDKLAPALHKLMEEDLLLRFYRDPQTNEFLLAGAGQLHIETVVSRLKRRFHTEVTLKSPKVPYRETIRIKATGHGRHKKQTGGHGQFADCKINIEPLPRGSGFEFVDDIFGGAIPRQFVPAVEKGIQESAARGYLAGYPLVDFRATVFDGSYHDVDSSEMAFKIAGRLALRACMEQARPSLLEPIMRVEIEAPDECTGPLIGDLNGRRGRVQGMESAGTGTIIRAQVPLAEMLTYGVTLTSTTHGRGNYRMEMDHYDFAPTAVADKIAAGMKRAAAEDSDA
ncbi:MAG: fusA 1 [Acidobacteriaceae bacterium]|nr:fusA 1 [Acidobacteriaceae bacterium]